MVPLLISVFYSLSRHLSWRSLASVILSLFGECYFLPFECYEIARRDVTIPSMKE